MPIRAAFDRAEEIARFSFVRVLRPMPQLRPLKPGITRAITKSGVSLPQSGPTDPAVRAVIFDGGLPDNARAALSRWVRYIEPVGVGKPDSDLQGHGLAVTSAFLFGQIVTGSALDTPFCTVDHVRVLDEDTNSNGDLMGLDVLNRILSHLDANPGYEFVNISLGPRLPVEDDDVTEWTATLDDRFSSGRAVTAVAVGNDGEAPDGLNRIQPPGDGVNLLAVGAANSLGPDWKRASYSCIGPSRSPGYVKPDGLAFGGGGSEPFQVLGPTLGISEIEGTSISSPVALRSAAAVRVQLATALSPLAIRALVLHRADPGPHERREVGWGRFEHDPEQIITCDDDESIVLYQGTLPVGEHLRVPVAVPNALLVGMVTVTATLVIAPDVDPQHPGAYTRSGLEVSFRPHSGKFNEYEDGKLFRSSQNKILLLGQQFLRGFGVRDAERPGTNGSRAYGTPRDYGPPPCLHLVSISTTTTARTGWRMSFPQPIPYAFVVGIRAPRVTDLYNQVVRSYSGRLVQLVPRLQLASARAYRTTT